MEAKRQIYWYSIITYMPSSIRYERINIGVVMGSYSTNKIFFKLLPVNSKKLDSFLWDFTEKKEFKSSVDLLEFILNRNSNKGDLVITPPNKFKNFKNWLNSELPYGIEFSDIHNAETASPGMIFNHLIDEYVGKQFFSIRSRTTDLKKHIDKVFYDKNLINKKLKPNVIVKPIENNPFDMKMDYAFQDNKMNLIQILNIDTINQWYTRMTTFLYKSSQNFSEQDLKIILVISEEDYKQHLDVNSLFNDVASDERVSNLFMSNNSKNTQLDKLVPKIEKANDINNWDFKKNNLLVTK